MGVIQTVRASVGGYWGSPAYWNEMVYYSGNKDFLSQYALSRGLLSTSPVYQAPTEFMFSSTPSVSANRSANGIIWTIERHLKIKGVFPPEILHAYQATKVSNELYNSSQAGTRDTLGPGITFAVPTVINGKVYVGAQGELDVLGLLN
jgi:hypothetical protein